MPKSDKKIQTKVTANIRRGSVSVAQSQQWKRWWSKLILEMQHEAKSEQKPTIVKHSGPTKSSEGMRENNNAQG